VAVAIPALVLVSSCGSGGAPSGSGTAGGLISVTSSGPTTGATEEQKPDSSVTGTVYMLWPQSAIPIWPLYTIPSVKNAFKEFLPNVKMVELNGNGDPILQQTQVEAAIAAKATAVVFSPVVPTAAGGALKAFAAAGIPVVALRQDPMGGPVSSYVWVDYAGVGEYWAKYIKDNIDKDFPDKKVVKASMILGDPSFEVYNRWRKAVDPTLDPLIKSGRIKIVCRQDIPKFNPALAQSAMDQCLTANPDLDVAIVMQDSTTNGMAASLAANNLLGKVKIYGGHDGDVQTLQRILLGQQYGTFHPDGVKTGLAAAAFTRAVILKKSVESTGYVNGMFLNGFYKDGVPTYLASETLVTAENMQKTIVDDGFLPKSAICTGAVVKTNFCTSN